MFIKTSVRIKDGKQYLTEYLVEGYRDPKTKKVKHRNLLALSQLPPNCILAIKSALGGDTKLSAKSLESLKVITTKEYGTVKVMGDIFDELFGKTLSNLPSPSTLKQLRAIKAIVLNKIFEPKSKYSLTNWMQRQDF